MDTTALYEVFLKSDGVSTDTRSLKKNTLFFALSGENFNGNKFAREALDKGAIAAVIDDASFNAENCILVDDALKALQHLATHHRDNLKTPVLALTGSNGKTTTKELITAVLSAKFEVIATRGNLNNHIGVPLSLLKLKRSTELAVIEMGANHQGEIAGLCQIARPDFGLITNFGKAHLEGFGGVEGVIKGKSELYRAVKSRQGILFINADDPVQMDQSKGGKRLFFGESPDNDCTIKFVEAAPFVQVEFDRETLKSKLIGHYNAGNISAAIAIGHYFKVEASKIKTAIESYSPDNNRSQVIEKNGKKIILDAYNANPTSVEAALKNFDQMQATYKIVILGDMFEIGRDSIHEHQAIVNQLDQMKLGSVFICGKHFAATEARGVHKSTTTLELCRQISQQDFPDGALFLIKGSRGMAMERVLEEF